jgi:hypothetical protein
MSLWPHHSCQLPDGRLRSSTIFLVWTCIGSFFEPNTFVFGKINLFSCYFQVLISLYFYKLAQLTKELTEFAVVWGGAGCIPVLLT